MSNYDVSMSELAILGELFEKETKVREITYPDLETKDNAFLDFVSQYEEDPDTDPHIRCLEGVTCEKEIEDVNWNEFYG